MFFYLVFIALVAAVNADPISFKRNQIFPNGRIIGGENAVIETYPYQVAHELFEQHNCGAAIISKHWIITAAHCVDVPPMKNWMRVRAGTSFMDQDGSLHKVEEIITHENYHTNDQGIPFNDIAVLRVKEPFQFDDKRQPIGLFEVDEEAKAGVSAVITGWGTTNNWKYEGQLQTVSIPIISKKLCNTAYEKTGGISEGQICAAYYGVGGKDACQGDSGGPLAIDGRLAGIVSWGNGCADPEYPGVYTEVAHYREWINNHTYDEDNRL